MTRTSKVSSDSGTATPRSNAMFNPAWRAVAATFAFNGALFGTWASRVPAFKSQFSLDSAELGLLLLTLAAGAIVSFPAAGLLTNRLGPERVTWMAAAMYGPAFALLGFAPNAASLAIALFLFGALHGAMDVGMNGWGSKVELALNRRFMSRFHALFSLGAGLGAGVGVLAARANIDPTTHLPVASIIFAVPTLILLFAANAHKANHAQQQSNGLPTAFFVLPRGTLLLVGFIAFGVSIGEGAMADWSAVFLRDVIQASEGSAALGYTIFSVAMVLTRLSGDSIVTWIGPVNVVRTSGVVAALGVAVVVFSDSLSTALIGFFLMGMGYAIVMPLVFSRAALDSKTNAGTAIASVATLGYGGMLLGPALVGFIAHTTTLTFSFSLLAILAFMVAVLAPEVETPQP